MDIIKIISEKNKEKLSQNNYLVVSGKDAIMIDASASVKATKENLALYGGVKLHAIFLTHCHFDHIAELDDLIAHYNCPVYIHKNGKHSLYKVEENLSFLDEPFTIKNRKNIKTFVDGDEMDFGEIHIKCYLTEGHSHDSSCFIVGDNMFTGDTVFKVCVGRTDMFGGNEFVQKISLKRIRDDLSNGVNNYYSGHGANFDYEGMKYIIDSVVGDK